MHHCRWQHRDTNALFPRLDPGSVALMLAIHKLFPPSTLLPAVFAPLLPSDRPAKCKLRPPSTFTILLELEEEGETDFHFPRISKDLVESETTDNEIISDQTRIAATGTRASNHRSRVSSHHSAPSPSEVQRRSCTSKVRRFGRGKGSWRKQKGAACFGGDTSVSTKCPSTTSKAKTVSS